MGKFTYDSTITVDFDDRILAHLQLVIGAKLRRGESFYFSWRDDVAIGDGRSTIWLFPSVPIHFKYRGGRPVHINRNWIEALMLTANSTVGLMIVPEPSESPAHEAQEVRMER